MYRGSAALQDVFYVRNLDQAMVLLKPQRLELLRHMSEPKSCPELANLVGDTPQKVYYHVKALENARLIEKVSERRVGGIMEGLYRARATSYWLAPELVGTIGGPSRARDQMSLGYLLSLAEQFQADVADLAGDRKETPSVGLSADIVLKDAEDRQSFLSDVQKAVQRIAERYGARSKAKPALSYRLILACYPHDTPAGKRSTGRKRKSP